MIRMSALSHEDVLPVGVSLRGGNSFRLFSLLASFYLIAALSVPGAFLIAKQASSVASGQFIVLAEHSSSEQLGASSGEGEDGGEGLWQGPKRLRAALLLTKAGLEKMASLLIASLAAPVTLLDEDTQSKTRVVVTGEVQLPKDEKFPQELLGRPPPSSLSS